MQVDAVALVLVALAACLVVLHAETCRRWLMRKEDARTMAAFRIACGVCTIGWTIELWPLLDYVFSDDGLFLTDTARQVFAAKGFAGIADGSVANEPARPLDVLAVLQLLASPRQSLLFFWDDPQTVRLHALALLGATLFFTLGLGTAVTKWLTLLLFHSLLARNSVFWAGEQVFSNFLLLTCLSRCGNAYSVDAWMRARRGRAAFDRAIPAWPRALALLQTIPMFTANGFAKTGEMWAAGDTLHYMLMHPHFQRFDSTVLASLFSTNLFRVMTWVTHGFELLFPLAIAGVVLRFHRSAGIAALTGARRQAARVVWIAAAIAMAGLAVLTLEGRERETLCFGIVIAAAATIVLLAIAGRWLPLDLDWICRWPLGRRIWVTLLVLFSGHLVLLTSIGWFTVLTMATAILFFDGAEVGAVLARLRRAPREEHAAPAPRDDAAVLPDRALALALVALVLAALVTVALDLPVLWCVALAAIGVTIALRARAHVDARRRFMVGWFCAFHVTAVTLVLLPTTDPRPAGRAAIEAPFRRWLEHAHANQFWRMFAPNGSRGVLGLEVDVTAAEGEVVAIGSGIPAPVGPLRLGRDKSEKIARRIAGEGNTEWYAKWHGRSVCRRWAFEHGTLPDEVKLWRTTRAIAPPEAYADPALVAEIEGETERESIWQQQCAHEVQAQPPMSPEFRPWEKPRTETWAELRAKGEVPDLPWPLAILALPWFVLRGRARFVAARDKPGV